MINFAPVLPLPFWMVTHFFCLVDECLLWSAVLLFCWAAPAGRLQASRADEAEQCLPGSSECAGVVVVSVAVKHVVSVLFCGSNQLAEISMVSHT